jgi:hypothetical protein
MHAPALQSKSYASTGDLDEVYRRTLAAREAVLSNATPQAMTQRMRRIFPYPCRYVMGLVVACYTRPTVYLLLLQLCLLNLYAHTQELLHSAGDGSEAWARRSRVCPTAPLVAGRVTRQ